MTRCFLVSDLHGVAARYRVLLDAIEAERPGAVFLAGDLLPSGSAPFLGAPSARSPGAFVTTFLAPRLRDLRLRLGSAYPSLFLVPGNDDPATEVLALREQAPPGLWHFAHGRRSMLAAHAVYGYAFTPPSPFRLKDWERYDVSRYVDPGCVRPEEGLRTIPVPEPDDAYATIGGDLEQLIGADEVHDAIFLFHAPPYRTALDRAALDGRMVDHVPMDVHVGSIAIRRMIEARQPMLTLHGHIHESARLTGRWRDRIGRTHLFSAAHDGPELALVRFELDDLDGAQRELLPAG